jgi:hypothetical protein
MARLRLFEEKKILFRSLVFREAEATGESLRSFFENTLADVWRATSSRRLPVADLSLAGIADRVPLTPAALSRADLHSVQCEVVRTVKDRLHVAALRLPTPPGELGSFHAVHRDAWELINAVHLGTLQDLFPPYPRGGSRDG